MILKEIKLEAPTQGNNYIQDRTANWRESLIESMLTIEAFHYICDLKFCPVRIGNSVNLNEFKIMFKICHYYLRGFSSLKTYGFINPFVLFFIST